LLCAHFTGTEPPDACGCCDACVDPDRVVARASRPERVITLLPAAEQQLVVDAVGALHRPIGKGNLAKALRGSQSKAMAAHGLLRLPQHGMLAERDEASIVAAIDGLIAQRRLVRRGRKYPTVALPGASRPRTPRDPARTPRTASSVTYELDTYRKRMARQLHWKSYMVFQRGVIAAIDKQRPATMEALARIPGLGPAKLARFGDDILAVIRRHARP
jgi:ATP-dependent DNA helicase RecQ